MKQLIKIIFIAAIFLLPKTTLAHVGSPGVTLEGKAGPYQLMILINPPDVIPGVATVDVYVQEPGNFDVEGKPVYWYAGGKGTPKADKGILVPNEPGHYQLNIWFMGHGTSSIEVKITGDKGEGSIVVPVMAVATAQKEMEASLGWTLAGLGLFLVILMVTIISLGMSYSLNKPAADKKKVAKKGWAGAAIATVIIALILYGGKSWWDSTSGDYNRYLYQPWQATSKIVKKDSLDYLHFQLDSMDLEILYSTRNINYLVPDHGKIMHMFLAKAGSLDAFAHIHPRRIDSLNFEAVLPPLPEGRYFIYADVTRLSGFSETIVDTVDVPKIDYDYEKVVARMHEDDTYFVTDALERQNSLTQIPTDIVVCGKPGMSTVLPDDSKAFWELPDDGEFIANKLYSLTFAISDERGNPAELEPYLGMMGHAVVLKEDASVYIHLHPVGSYSTASQQTLEARIGEAGIDWDALPKPSDFADSINQWTEKINKLPAKERDEILIADMDHDWLDPDHPDHAVVRFPYAFPSPGNYRVFIQMKRNGKVLNSAFDVNVKE